MNTTTLAAPSLASSNDPAQRLTAALAARLRAAGLGLWRALEAYGSANAQRELRNLHDRWEASDPALAKQLRAANAFLVAEDRRRG